MEDSKKVILEMTPEIVDVPSYVTEIFDVIEKHNLGPAETLNSLSNIVASVLMSFNVSSQEFKDVLDKTIQYLRENDTLNRGTH